MTTDDNEVRDAQPGGWAPLICLAWLICELVVLWLLVWGMTVHVPPSSSAIGEGPVSLVAYLLMACIAGLAFGVAMAKEHRTVWLLPAVPIAALLAVAAITPAVADKGDGYDPGLAFLIMLIVLGVP